ncbi:MAG: ankyrin repeat domain-containing protein [Acidobacteriota bacterium]
MTPWLVALLALANAPTEEDVRRLLVGDWCLNTEEYEGEVSADGSRWTFREGGRYVYRTHYVSEDDYRIEGNVVVLANFGRLEVLSIDEQRMTAKLYSTYLFSRNDCLPVVAEAVLKTRLNNALVVGDLETVRTLLEQGVDASGPDTRSGLRSTPLMIAVRFGGVEAVRLILSRKPDLTVENSLGETALELARRQATAEVAALIETAAHP